MAPRTRSLGRIDRLSALPSELRRAVVLALVRDDKPTKYLLDPRDFRQLLEEDTLKTARSLDRESLWALAATSRVWQDATAPWRKASLMLIIGDDREEQTKSSVQEGKHLRQLSFGVATAIGLDDVGKLFAGVFQRFAESVAHSPFVSTLRLDYLTSGLVPNLFDRLPGGASHLERLQLSCGLCAEESFAEAMEECVNLKTLSIDFFVPPGSEETTETDYSVALDGIRQLQKLENLRIKWAVKLPDQLSPVLADRWEAPIRRLEWVDGRQRTTQHAARFASHFAATLETFSLRTGTPDEEDLLPPSDQPLPLFEHLSQIDLLRTGFVSSSQSAKLLVPEIANLLRSQAGAKGELTLECTRDDLACLDWLLECSHNTFKLVCGHVGLSTVQLGTVPEGEEQDVEANGLMDFLAFSGSLNREGVATKWKASKISLHFTIQQGPEKALIMAILADGAPSRLLAENIEGSVEASMRTRASRRQLLRDIAASGMSQEEMELYDEAAAEFDVDDDSDAEDWPTQDESGVAGNSQPSRSGTEE